MRYVPLLYLAGTVYAVILLWTLHYSSYVVKTADYGKEGETEELSFNLEENLKLIDDKKQIQSVLCSLPQCSEGCDVCCNLPYNYNKRKITVHHWLAETGLWNEDSRFLNLPLDKDSMVVYVGANNKGADGKTLLDMFNCTIHMYEPVPVFFAELSTLWDKYKEELGYDATLYNYGLGKNNRTVNLAAEDLDGQGTFGMEGNTEKEEIPLEIREGSSALRDVGDTIDLLHVNCEGCEWEMFDNLIETGLLSTIRLIQFSSHFFPQVPDLVRRYCRIKTELAKTHTMVYGQSFGWERWDLMQ